MIQSRAMKTNTNPVEELNKILRETFAGEVKGMIARAPMWGHSDNCWIFYGAKAAFAGAMLAKKLGASMKTEKTGLGETVTLEWV
jgi:hypothetical protein